MHARLLTEVLDRVVRSPLFVGPAAAALLSASGGKNSSSSSGGSGGRGASLFSASIPAHGSMAFLLSVVSTDKAGGKSAQEICGI